MILGEGGTIELRKYVDTTVGQAHTFVATRLALQARAMAEAAVMGRRDA
jgi:hypothetical protein